MREVERVERVRRDQRRERREHDERDEDSDGDGRLTRTIAIGSRPHAASRVRGSSACTATSARKLSITTATDAHMRNAMSTV